MILILSVIQLIQECKKKHIESEDLKLTIKKKINNQEEEIETIKIMEQKTQIKHKNSLNKKKKPIIEIRDPKSRFNNK